MVPTKCYHSGLTPQFNTWLVVCRDMSARVEVRRVSQFCKPLWNILHDQGSLSTMEYWIQFLISKNCLHLLQFWLSVDSFKNASSSLNKCPSRPLAAESRQVEWAAVDCLATAGALAGQDSERVSSCKASVSQGVQNSLPKGKMKPQSPVELQSQEAGTSSALNGVGRKVVVDGDMTKGSQSNMRSQELGGELARQTSLSRSLKPSVLHVHIYHLRQCTLCLSELRARVHTMLVNVTTC